MDLLVFPTFFSPDFVFPRLTRLVFHAADPSISCRARRGVFLRHFLFPPPYSKLSMGFLPLFSPPLSLLHEPVSLYRRGRSAARSRYPSMFYLLYELISLYVSIIDPVVVKEGSPEDLPFRFLMSLFSIEGAYNITPHYTWPPFV